VAELREFLPGGEIPDLYLPTRRRRGQHAAVGRERDAREAARHPELLEALPGGHVCEEDGAAAPSRGQGLAVGCEDDGVDVQLLARELAAQSSGGGVPEPDRAVVVRGGEQPAIGREGEAMRP